MKPFRNIRRSWEGSANPLVAAKPSVIPTVKWCVARGKSRRGSACEGEVMTLFDKGATNRALADTLVVTLDTVKRHATDIWRVSGWQPEAGRSR